MHKPLGQEHWKFDDKGNFVGLYTISAEKAREMYGDSRWFDGVRHIIKDYYRVHPGELNFQAMQNDLTKSTNFNKYGATKDSGYRHALEIPAGLHAVLSEYHPELFTDRAKLHRLMKEFPALAACSVV